MAKEPGEAFVDVWVALMRAQQSAMLKVERSAREAELPPVAWYDVLWELERAGDAGLRPSDIERQRLISQSNISRLIDRLEEAGYVERRPCEDDKRGQIVAITAAGRETRKRMWPTYFKALRDAIGGRISVREATILAGLLTKLAK